MIDVTHEDWAGFHHKPVGVPSCHVLDESSTLPTEALSVAVPVIVTGPSGSTTLWFAGRVIVGVDGLTASWSFARFGSKTWIRSLPVSVT